MHYATYHSAVEGFAHGSTSLKAVRKKLASIRPKPTPPGPRPKPQRPKKESYFDFLISKLGAVRDYRVSAWIIPYSFSGAWA